MGNTTKPASILTASPYHEMNDAEEISLPELKRVQASTERLIFVSPLLEASGSSIYWCNRSSASRLRGLAVWVLIGASACTLLKYCTQEPTGLVAFAEDRISRAKDSGV